MFHRSSKILFWFVFVIVGISECVCGPPLVKGKGPRKKWRRPTVGNEVPLNINNGDNATETGPRTYDTDANSDDFRNLQRNGNITVTSKECEKVGCTGSWGAWQSWSDCNIPLPNRSPMCHNTLQLRKRFCAEREICHETQWDFCVDVPSCIGQWTQWSNYIGDCDIQCTKEIHRNRTCLDPDGVESPGLCLGSKTEKNQSETEQCIDASCGLTFDITMGLIIGGGALFLILIVVIVFVVCVKGGLKHPRGESSLVTSQSFLLGQWRIISQRFTRRTRTEPRAQGQHEVAIGNNYSAVHVYENPDDYAEVMDHEPDNIYENSSQTYAVPLKSTESKSRTSTESKSRTSTVLSEGRYEYIDVCGPYASMEPLGSFSAVTCREHFKRAQSVDDSLMAQRNMQRTQHLPGIARKIPHPRGASQFAVHRNKGLSKKTLNAFTFKQGRNGAVASKITKRKNSTRKHNASNSYVDDIATCSTIVQYNSVLEEDRYGYMVPNTNGDAWRRQKNKTFSGLARYTSPKFTKSTSLPADVETYVTMNCGRP